MHDRRPKMFNYSVGSVRVYVLNRLCDRQIEKTIKKRGHRFFTHCCQCVGIVCECIQVRGFACYKIKFNQPVSA